MSVYGLTQRNKVIKLHLQGHSGIQIAKQLNISLPTIYSYLAKHRQGDLAPAKPGRKGHTKLTDTHLQLMRDLIAAKPDITLKDIQQQLDIDVELSTISRALKKMGITRKKKRSTPKNNLDPTSSRNAKTS